MKFVIVHFNTPQVTTCLCSSIRKFHVNDDIIIFDNSTSQPFPTENVKLFNITYLDNTKQTLLNFNQILAQYKLDKTFAHNNYGSVKHAITIQYLIDTLSTEFILMDSDTLLKKSIDFADSRYATIGALSKREHKQKAIRKYRILPYLQYFNTSILHNFHIRYLDYNKIYGINTSARRIRHTVLVF